MIGMARLGTSTADGIPTTAQRPAVRKALRRSRSWRSTVASSMWWLCSIRSIMSASSGADPVASASAWSCSSVTRTRAAADHSCVWSRPARVCTSSSEAATVVRSVAPVRRVRRAARGSTSAWANRSTSPSGFRNSLVTSAASSMSTTRCRPVAGRKTARRRPSSATSSRWTPERLDPRAPISSPDRLSRSSSPTPAITVRRGWNARENVVDPASITRRSYRTLRTVGGCVAELSGRPLSVTTVTDSGSSPCPCAAPWPPGSRGAARR